MHHRVFGISRSVVAPRSRIHMCLMCFHIVAHDHRSRYLSLFFSICGVYLSAPSLSTWNANNTAPHTRRATAIAIGFIMTNSGGILATWLLGTLSPPPHYTLATRVLLGFSVAMLLLTVLNIMYLKNENARKRATRGRVGLKRHERPGMGDRSAWFIYAL
jgi:hypothetical protein